MTLKDMLNTRTITRKQYNVAVNGTDWRVTHDGDLWVTIKGKRLLINRRGAIAFDGKSLTGQ